MLLLLDTKYSTQIEEFNFGNPKLSYSVFCQIVLKLSKMKKVLIYFPVFPDAPGGSEFRPISFVSELQKFCEVTLVLEKACDIEHVSKQLGISIDTTRLKVKVLKPCCKLLFKLERIIPFYRTWQLKHLALQCLSSED